MDASVLIAAERREFDLKERLGEHQGEQFALSAVTASEILHGLLRSTFAHRRHRQEYVEGLLADYPVIPFDLAAARVHARIWSELATQGITLGSHDLMIAATALAKGYRVATRDRRSFPKIPGLSLLVW